MSAVSGNSGSTHQLKEVGQRLLDARQAAQMLGVGESTFHRHRALGLIGPKPIKLGGSIRWDAVHMGQWIDAGCPDSKTWEAIHEADRLRGTPQSSLRILPKRG